MTKASGSSASPNRATAKFVALFTDQLIPMPGRKFNESVLRHQARVPDNHVILRDHNHPHDPVVPRDSDIDLCDGSEFYSVPECDIDKDRSKECPAPPKFVVAVDDKFETVLREDQTGESINDLFEIDGDLNLFRDLESPNDQKIKPRESIHLKNGNAFITRRRRKLKISVNNVEFLRKDGVRHEMTGKEIGMLAFPDVRTFEVTEITGGKEDKIPLNQTIKIDNCDEFEVIACDVNAGFQHSRIEREIDLLRSGGGVVDFIEEPVPVVIYRGLKIRRKEETYVEDVLVKVPQGYPSGIPDNAFLPVSSALMNITLGSAQNEFVEIDGRRWQKKSIHPYTGKARDRWNQNAHGFHSYLGEVLSWLSA